ncbi:hypothetical protein J2S43_000966 [Catenuloplanes nepalensis]|uniref:Uncharacterized protein n=1 Tax=Catenuloplanes nepalensis TaxID=587533 RepID=A0ABT9MM40_9ACTN|nr:hypothetical protein [Catenuloplanes nepalensis]MDP9792454.1 hypothetical protein [Catenuloplanes nepalensis]
MFYSAVARLRAELVLLPGVPTLRVDVAGARKAAETRLYAALAGVVTAEQGADRFSTPTWPGFRPTRAGTSTSTAITRFGCRTSAVPGGRCVIPTSVIPMSRADRSGRGGERIGVGAR